MKAATRKISGALDAILKYVSLACMAALFVILVCNVFFRMVPLLSAIPSFSMGWFDEIVEFLFAWMVMTTASYLCKKGEHFRVDLIQMKLKGSRANYILEAAINIISLIFYAALFYYGARLTAQAVQTTPVLMMEKRWWYLSIPVNAGLMTVFTLAEFLGNVHGVFKPGGKQAPAPTTAEA